MLCSRARVAAAAILLEQPAFLTAIVASAWGSQLPHSHPAFVQITDMMAALPCCSFSVRQLQQCGLQVLGLMTPGAVQGGSRGQWCYFVELERMFDLEMCRLSSAACPSLALMCIDVWFSSVQEIDTFAGWAVCDIVTHH